MRILFVVHGFPPEQPGVWTYHHAHALAAHHEVCAFVFTPDSERKQFEQWQYLDGPVLVWRFNNVHINHLRGFANPEIDAIFDYALEYFKPDVVHFEHLIGLSATMLTRTYRRTIPSVLALYDYYWVCPRINLVRGDYSLCPGPSHAFDCVTCIEGPGDPPPAPRRPGDSLPDVTPGSPTTIRSVASTVDDPPVVPWHLMLHDYRLGSMRVLLDYPDVITACSDSLRDDLTEMTGLPPGHIRTVSLGLPPLSQPVERTPSERVRIRYLGSILPHKGIHVLAEAATLLTDLPVEIHLHGAGEPKYLEEIRSRSAAIVHHAPYQHDQLAGILSETDIVVLPTLSRETFSFVIREAAQAGVPVVASRLGSIPEYIRDGESGLLVPPGSVEALAAALRRLVTDADLRARLAAAAAPIRSR
ncbi:MAG TPA: glycosyltransferase, partial [Thermomicrobiales bacterium]